MTLEAMGVAANSYTDENYSNSVMMAYANEGIGQINAELDCNLPFITSTTANYTALSETYLRLLIIPYICYSIKMNDSSVTEAAFYENKFQLGLIKLRNNKDSAIASTYQNQGFSGMFIMSYDKLRSAGILPTTLLGSDEYSEYTQYYVGDYVNYSDLYYVCIKDSLGNLPTNTTYWREVDA